MSVKTNKGKMAPGVEELVGGLFSLLIGAGLISEVNRISSLFAVLLILVNYRFLRDWPFEGPKRRPDDRLLCFKAGLLLTMDAYFVVQITGSVFSPFYPGLFILMALSGAIQRCYSLKAGIFLIAAGFESLSWLASGVSDLRFLAIQSLAIGGFVFITEMTGYLNAFVGEKLKYLHSHSISGAVSTGKGRNAASSGQKEEAAFLPSGHLLAMLRLAIDAECIVAYRINSKNAILDQADCKGDGQLKEEVNTLTGVFAAMLRDKKPLYIPKIGRSARLLTYRKSSIKVTAFLGTTLLAGDAPVGFLLADSPCPGHFDQKKQEIFNVAAAQLAACWSAEAGLKRMNRLNNQALSLYDATEGLIGAQDLVSVLEEILKSLFKIYPGTDAAMLLFNSREEQGIVIKGIRTTPIFARLEKKVLDLVLPAEKSLCSLAIKLNRILPGEETPGKTWTQEEIFGKEIGFEKISSFKIVPIRKTAARESSIGAIVALSSQKDAFISSDPEKTRTLETVSNIAAIGIQNAIQYEHLRILAEYDSLTGLYTRRRFFEIMEKVMAEARRYGHPVAFMIADLDHFKKINDRYGHPVGDIVLMKVAEIFRKEAREADVVCRYGGEEFAVLLPHTDARGGALMAERFRQAVGELLFERKDLRFKVNISIGVAAFPENAKDQKMLLVNADHALYESKKSGRNRVTVF